MIRLLGKLVFKAKSRQTKRTRQRKRGLNYGQLERREMLTTFVINSLVDDASGTVDGLISLREAIIAANTNMAFGDAPAGSVNGDIVQFPSALSGFTTTLTQGEITISDDLVIQGGNTTVDGNMASRLFNVTTNERVGFGRLTFANGMASQGAAINSAAGQRFTFESTFTNNIATGLGGGAIYAGSGAFNITDSDFTGNQATGAISRGGAVYSASANVFVDGGMMMSNSATTAGGAIEVINGNFQTFNMIASQNTAGTAGGAIHISGSATVVVSDGEITQNEANVEGGGIWNGSSADLFLRADAEVTNNTATGSSTDNGGGGVYNDGGEVFVNFSTISGNMASGTFGSGGGVFSNGGKVLFNNSTVDGNMSARAGGGVEAAAAAFISLDASTISNNDAGITFTGSPGNGGGVHTTGINNTISLFNSSVIENNQAKDDGGGIWNDLGSNVFVRDSSRVTSNNTDSLTPGGLGGGVFTEGFIQVEDSVINLNTAVLSGGGLYVATTGQARFDRSNVSGNNANNFGGGIYNQGFVRMDDSNVTSNTVSADGGGIFTEDGAETILNNVGFSNNIPNNQN